MCLDLNAIARALSYKTETGLADDWPIFFAYVARPVKSGKEVVLSSFPELRSNFI
jgi:hypothetical protein